jgi:hypothetical protein
MLWNELVRVAILGTDRGKLSRNALGQLEALSLASGNREKDPALFLLEASAACQLYRRAGRKMPVFRKEQPTPAPEDSAYIPLSAHKYLQKVLGGVFAPSLKELLSYIAQKKRVVHPRFLPELFELALKQKDLLPLLQAVSGNRGPWLAGQLPDWASLFPAPNPLRLPGQTPEQRRQLLESIRRKDPQKGLDWLEENWKAEASGTRPALFRMLKTGLSESDIPFLEARLKERKKEVRAIASEFLAQLPASAFYQALNGKLKEWVGMNKRSTKGKLAVNLPEDMLDRLADIGLPLSSDWTSEGVKKGAFLQVLALMPPNSWMPAEGPPKQQLLYLVRHEWGLELIQAMTRSALLHGDFAWQQALLHFWLENYHRDRWHKLDMEPLLKQLPRPVLWKVGAAVLPHAGPITEEDNPIARLLLARDHLWDKELSLAFFYHFLDWLRNSMRSSWDGWVYRKILTRAAYSCHPGLVDLLSREWAPTYAGQWDKDRDRFFRTLRFRREMIQSLETKSEG